MHINLLNCTPKPAKLLITDISVRIDIYNFVNFMHFFLAVRVSIIRACIVDPKSSESEVEGTIG